MNDRFHRRLLVAAVLFGAAHATSLHALPATGAGALDPTFGDGAGVVTTKTARGMEPQSAVLQPDGKLVVGSVVASDHGTFDLGLTRYLDSGALDPAFGSDGIGVYPLGSNAVPGQYGTVVDANGRILVAGYTRPDSNYRCAIVAVLPNGTIDASFGANGLVEFRLTPGKDSVCSGAVVQGDGAIVASGHQQTGASYDGFVVRFTADGRLDLSFNGSGSRIFESATGFVPRQLLQAPDGSLLLAGSTGLKSRNGLLFRMHADGSLDPAFANAGRFESAVPGWIGVGFYGVTVLPDGKIVVVGQRGESQTSPFMARLTPEGVPDSAFGVGGFLEFALNGATGYARSVVLLRDGRFYVELRAVLPGNAFRFAAARLLPSGALDATFGAGGVVILPQSAAMINDLNYGMAVAADGKVWLSGSSSLLVGSTQTVARILGDEIRSPIVEFYNTVLDHYFITADFGESIAIDSGAAGPGWKRTGQWFKSGGPSRSCRFYGSPEISPATGKRMGPNGHFYTLSADECATVKDDGGWKFESYDFSGWPLPATGQCAAGTIAVKRVYNNRFAVNDSNHRYITSDAIYNQMLASGWSGEGAVFCAPQ